MRYRIFTFVQGDSPLVISTKKDIIISRKLTMELISCWGVNTALSKNFIRTSSAHFDQNWFSRGNYKILTNTYKTKTSSGYYF